jgi:hypothetical protein
MRGRRQRHVARCVCALILVSLGAGEARRDASRLRRPTPRRGARQRGAPAAGVAEEVVGLALPALRRTFDDHLTPAQCNELLACVALTWRPSSTEKPE